MKLIVKHFPKHRMKLSYSCMQNMGNIITKHKNKLLFQSFEQPTPMCNCRDKASCPMDVNCLQKCFVYQTLVDSANSRKYYLGTSEDEFKTGCNNPTMSFRKKRSWKENWTFKICLGIERQRWRFYHQMECCCKSLPLYMW